MQIEISIGKVGIYATPPKQILIKKGTDIKHFIALQMQKYLTQGGIQTPKIYLWIQTKKSVKLSI